MDLTLGKMPNERTASAQTQANPSDNGVPHLGLELAPASDVSGAGGKGVAVVGVDPDGPAAERGFKTGDIILDVSGKSVASVADVRRAIRQAHEAGKKDVLMRVKTAQATRFVAVPVGRG